MNGVSWEIAHSVDANASPAFAWAYMTNVANWNDPPATFELDGPFMAGSRGTTRTPGQEARHWQIREVIPTRSYTLEMALDGAAMSFEWRFDRIADGVTQLTQHIVLKGENAAAYVAQVQSAFTSSLAAGMRKIAAAIELAESVASDAGEPGTAGDLG